MHGRAKSLAEVISDMQYIRQQLSICCLVAVSDVVDCNLGTLTRKIQKPVEDWEVWQDVVSNVLRICRMPRRSCCQAHGANDSIAKRILSIDS